MPSLIKQHGRYYLQFFNSRRQPKQKRVALGTGNRRLAEQLESRLMAAFLLGEYDPWGEPYSEIQTLGEAFAGFMERKRNLRRNTQDNYRWIVGSFVRHAGSSLPIESLTSRHIQRWLDSTDTNDQGRYSYWQRAGIFCRFLVSQGLLKSDLSKGLTVVRPPQRLSNKVISETDLQNIRVIAKQLGLNYLADVSLVTFDLALRLTEVCCLKKDWIDFEKARLTIKQDQTFATKSGREVVKPITNRSLVILERLCLPSIDGDRVFRNTRGNPLDPKWTIKMFKRTVRRLGLPETITFHGLRHGGISKLVETGASLEVVRRFAGHASVEMTLRYCHLSDDSYHRLFSKWMGGRVSSIQLPKSGLVITFCYQQIRTPTIGPSLFLHVKTFEIAPSAVDTRRGATRALRRSAACSNQISLGACGT